MSKSELSPEGRQTYEGSETMAATSVVRKASGRKTAKVKSGRGTKPAPEERRKLNRVGTQVHENLSEPSSVGARMSKRRLELGLTQAQVADKVTFTPQSGRRLGQDVPLSRSGYCMYETSGLVPDIDKIIGIARALKTTPQYIAFGVVEDEDVQEYLFDSKRGFYADGKWRLPAAWLRQQYDLNAEALGAFMISDYSESFVAGDVALFHKSVEPTGSGGSFIFALKGEVKIAHISRPPRSDVYRIFHADLKGHDEYPIKQVTILGRVVGKIGSLERS